MSEREKFGPEEYGLLYPTFRGGKADRIMFYTSQPELNTLGHMEEERQRWIDRGEEAFVVSRQWKILE
jgi:hypothetical protein